MKLIVSDFDGTYFVDDINILKNNQYIDKFRFNNNLFMLSSGRSFKSLKEMTIKYNIKYDYLSCCDGSILYDNKDNILIKFSLNNSILKKFLSLKHFAKIERIQYSYDDDYYNERKNNDLIGCNFVIKNENITNKFLKEFDKLKEKYTEFDFLIYSHDEITFFCLKNKGINKSSTIKYLKDYLNLNYNDIYVFGDNDNDYPMLKEFNGFYIGQVNNSIKEVCKGGFNQVYEFDLEKND
ncbi:MAG: HAD-IIB family hydrolase [Bacilli bacterium]|nr:HAD-IIB family hydrolase [Bacilli bacterium]